MKTPVYTTIDIKDRKLLDELKRITNLTNAEIFKFGIEFLGAEKDLCDHPDCKLLKNLHKLQELKNNENTEKQN
jgi:hypothetical protein